MAADIRQRGGRRIRDLLFGENGPEDLVLQVLVGRQGIKQRVQHRFGVVLGHIALDGSGAAQHPGDPQQFNRLQAAAAVRPLQAGGYVHNVGKGGVSLPGAEVRGRGGLRQQLPHRVQVGIRRQRQTGRLAALASGALGKHGKHLSQLQLGQGFFI